MKEMQERRPCIVIEEMGLTLLYQAFVPHYLWLEAFSIAMYLKNRLPTPVLGNQVLFGTPPLYSHLRVFGCACYPHLGPEKINYSLNLQSVFFLVIVLSTRVTRKDPY